MSGDGLTDWVRLRNGEVCYGPNLGYGRCGAKVSMDCKLGGAQMQPSGEDDVSRAREACPFVLRLAVLCRPPTPGGTREGGVEPDRRISSAAGAGIVRRYEGELGSATGRTGAAVVSAPRSPWTVNSNPFGGVQIQASGQWGMRTTSRACARTQPFLLCRAILPKPSSQTHLPGARFMTPHSRMRELSEIEPSAPV